MLVLLSKMLTHDSFSDQGKVHRVAHIHEDESQIFSSEMTVVSTSKLLIKLLVLLPQIPVATSIYSTNHWFW